MKNYFVTFLLALTSLIAFGQMNIDGKTKYGNEWIDYTKTYFKISITEDGIYKISYQDLVNAGFPINEVAGAYLQLFHFGREIAILPSTEDNLSPNDYILFYAQKNRGELDWYLYEDPTQRQLNPDYSMYSDTSSYYLTWTTGVNNKRYSFSKSDLTNNLPTKEEYYFHTDKKIFSDFHQKPVREGNDDIRYSSFDVGEGFGSKLSQKNAFDFQIKDLYTNGPKSKANIRYTGNSVSHVTQFIVNGEVLKNSTDSGYYLKTFDEFVDESLLKTNTKIELNGTASINDRYVVASVSLTYPRLFKANVPETFNFTIESSLFNKYIEIEDFDITGAVPVLLDITNGIQLEAIIQDSKIVFILPPSNSERRIVLFKPNRDEKPVPTLSKKTFVDYTQADAEYIIISNSQLYDDGSGNNPVQTYADYRASDIGGGFKSVVVDIDQLYDQYAYGVYRNPLSIRNFTAYISENWTNPQFVFLLGKGRHYSNTRDELSEQAKKEFYLPTFGVPGSDNLLVGALGTSVARIPVGRLAARTTTDVVNYLDKVKLHEKPLTNQQSIEDQQWKKNTIHLSGGGNLGEQNLIFNYLKSMANIITQNKFGGRTITYQKTSSDPIQTALSTEIVNNINNGCSILTFFGHSSAGTFDFSIEDPSEYQNYGKYPMILSLGCFSGDIYTSSKGISESFVLEKDRGSIGFIASTGSAYLQNQGNSGGDIYDLLGGEYYGQSIGAVMQEAIRRRDGNASVGVVTLNEQLTLHGDPAVKLHPMEGIDLTFDFESLRTEPSIISTNLDSFDLFFDVVNIGQYQVDSVNVDIKHQAPDGSMVYQTIVRIPTPAYSATIKVSIPNPGIKAIGKNVFLMTIDPDDDLDERPDPSAEQNNELKNDKNEIGYCFYILDNGARGVYPPDFAIVGSPDVKLSASTSNAFLDQQKYIFQIDTTENFNSPLLETAQVDQGGGLIQWQPSLPMVDERVYYWRVSADSTVANIGYIWDQKSFVYLAGSQPGWNQSHYFQMIKNDFDGLDLPISRQLEFDTSGFSITIKNKVYDSLLPPGYQVNNDKFAESVNPWQFMDAGIAIVIGNGLTGGALRNNGGDYGSISTGSLGSTRTFGFNTNTLEDRIKVMDFLENVVQDGDYVFVFTVLKTINSDFNPGTWSADESAIGRSIFTVLESYGAKAVRGLEEIGSVPYNFIAQKNGSVLGEDIASSKDDLISTISFIPIKRTEGELESVLVGPAIEWDKLEWNEETRLANEDSYIEVFAHGDTTVSVGVYKDVYEVDLSTIDAKKYPHISISYFAKDETLRTANPLNLWRVYYKGIPDAAINPFAHLVFQKDTLEQGEDLNVEIAIDNLTQSNMDSLLVRYSILNSENKDEETFDRLEPLTKEGRIISKFKRNTQDLLGEYQFTIEVNPNKDQIEKFSFNNFGIREFYVNKDNINPLLDVTFDGIHIMDGDLVSSNPVIVLTLKDNNTFLPINDISLFDLALLSEDGSVWNIPLDDPSLNFIPASGEGENKATLQFSPQLSDGKYKFVAQAKDASGNFSGNQAYEVNFEVITATSISSVLNYPNPFSTSTQFVFTLTGELLSDMYIQIMTLSGKVVREITMQELGNIHVGINRSDYRWNGTDDFGNRLANGVYLYRVVTKGADGMDFDQFNTTIDGYFKDGFGKMVIMR